MVGFEILIQNLLCCTVSFFREKVKTLHINKHLNFPVHKRFRSEFIEIPRVNVKAQDPCEVRPSSKNFLPRISVPCHDPPAFHKFPTGWFWFWKFNNFRFFWKISQKITLAFTLVRTWVTRSISRVIREFTKPQRRRRGQRRFKVGTHDGTSPCD